MSSLEEILHEYAVLGRWPFMNVLENSIHQQIVGGVYFLIVSKQAPLHPHAPLFTGCSFSVHERFVICWRTTYL